MKTGKMKIAAVLTVVFAQALSAAETASDADNAALSVARALVNYARDNGIKNTAVLGFATAGSPENDAADAVSDSVSSYMTTYRTTTSAERSALKETLAALKNTSGSRSKADGAKILQDIFAVDAAVTGTVFEKGGNIKIVARLTDMRTGKVLFTAASGDAAAGELSARSAELPGFAGVSVGGSPAELPRQPGDLKDAVADYKESSCSWRKIRLAQLNTELVEVKAEYWADKISEPLFRRRTGRKNPGIEIADPSVRARFYELLTGYFQAENRKSVTADKLTAVLDLMESEARFFGECGLP